jgi:hypothetical protein
MSLITYVSLGLEAVLWECYLGNGCFLPSHILTYEDITIVTSEDYRVIRQGYNNGLSTIIYHNVVKKVLEGNIHYEHLEITDVSTIEKVSNLMKGSGSHTYIGSTHMQRMLGDPTYDVQAILNVRDDDVIKQCLLPHTDILSLISGQSDEDKWLRECLLFVRLLRIYKVLTPFYTSDKKDERLYDYKYDIDFYYQ